MIGGLLRHKLVEPGAITAADRHLERLSEVRDLFHVQTSQDNRIAARKARIVVLSVKPQVLTAVCADLNGVLRAVDLGGVDCGGRPPSRRSRLAWVTRRSCGRCPTPRHRWRRDDRVDRDRRGVGCPAGAGGRHSECAREAPLRARRRISRQGDRRQRQRAGLCLSVDGGADRRPPCISGGRAPMPGRWSSRR